MSRPSSRRQFLAVAVTLAAVLGALPFQSALAAPRGTQAAASILPLLGVVSAGQTAAFDATLTSSGTATLANLRFDGSVSNGAQVLSANAPCAIDGPDIHCTLPSLAGGASLTVRVLVTAPAGAGQLQFAGAFSAEGGRSNPGGSVDTWPASASLAVSNSADLLSRWQQAHGSITLPTVGHADEQLTKVSVPPVGYGYAALVRHGDDAIVCGAETIAGIGQTVTAAIAGGSSPIRLEIAYDRDVLDRTTPSTIEVVHQLDDGTCEFPPRNCRSHAGFCYDAKWQGSGANKKLVLQVQLPHNGKARGY